MDFEPDLQNLEANYRQSALAGDRHLTRYAAIAFLIFSAFFILPDYMFFNLSAKFFNLLIAKFVYLLLTISFLVILRRIHRFEAYDWLVFAWILITSVYAWVSNMSRPSTYLGHYIMDVLVVVIFYLIPNRFIFRMLSAIFYSSSMLLGIIFIKTQVEPVEFNIVVMGCLAANVLGMIASTRLYTFRREQFRLLTDEKVIKEELARLAMTDPLTGLFNRRKFMELGDQEFKRFSRYHVVFSVQIIDLDFFKKVNDRFGHPAGDEALKQFSQLVIKQKRETDLLGRLGGEEFGILLLNTPVEAAAIFGERLRHLVQVTPITLGENQVGITISMGVTQAHSSDKNFGDVLLRADRLLYQAKGNGRNRMETSV